MKICLLGVELFHAKRRTDGQTGMTKLIVAFNNPANAPEKSPHVPIRLKSGKNDRNLHLGFFTRRVTSVNNVTIACMVAVLNLVTKAISVFVVFVATRTHQKCFTLRTYLSCCNLLCYH